MIVTFNNATLFGADTVKVNSVLVESVTEEKTEFSCCTIRLKHKGGHYRVMGTKEEVCNALGLDVKVIPSLS